VPSTLGLERRGFRHEAVFYHGLDDLAGLLVPFLREGIGRGESALVALPADRLVVIERALGADAGAVSFLDMTEVGRNPARIIGEWRRFTDEHTDAPGVRGVGEPVWRGRRPEELEECRLHESLLNLAFDDGPGWQLVCPYDADALPAPVLQQARATHPVVRLDGVPASVPHGGHLYARDAFTEPLSPAPSDADEIPFNAPDLSGLRAVVRRVCEQAGLTWARSDDLVLAVHELATNSVEHGGGGGVLRAWIQPDALVFEVSDLGVIADPLVGRRPAANLALGGRGVWLVNQLCDLVQVRSSEDGTVVRLYTWLTPGRA
jgi:anti-sigma regulatory factor (Ser/Thr protein kinase)